MPRKQTAVDTEEMVLIWLAHKAEVYEDLLAEDRALPPGRRKLGDKTSEESFLRVGRSFTMHEIEEKCRLWWKQHAKFIAGSTLTRAAFRVLKSHILGKVDDEIVTGKRYKRYTHTKSSDEIIDLVAGKEFKEMWKHPQREQRPAPPEQVADAHYFEGADWTDEEKEALRKRQEK
jgi:hypothetical protein